jgi:hypothetical protein
MWSVTGLDITATRIVMATLVVVRTARFVSVLGARTWATFSARARITAAVRTIFASQITELHEHAYSARPRVQCERLSANDDPDVVYDKESNIYIHIHVHVHAFWHHHVPDDDCLDDSDY